MSPQIIAAENPIDHNHGISSEVWRDILEICQEKRQSSTETMPHLNLINDLVKLS